MRKVMVEEDSWIQVCRHGTLITGQLGKYYDYQPFGENNLCIRGEDFAYSICLKQIVNVFPKVILKEKPVHINPSKRISDEPK